MGKEAPREVSAGAGLFGRGGKGSHWAIVDVAHCAARAHVDAQTVRQGGDFGEFRLIVQRTVFAHALRLGCLAADNAAADDHVRETEADGVKAL